MSVAVDDDLNEGDDHSEHHPDVNNFHIGSCWKALGNTHEAIEERVSIRKCLPVLTRSPGPGGR